MAGRATPLKHSTKLPGGTELKLGFPLMHSLKRLNNLKLNKLLKARAREITKLMTLTWEVISSQCLCTITLLQKFLRKSPRNLKEPLRTWPTHKHSLIVKTRTHYSTLWETLKMSLHGTIELQQTILLHLKMMIINRTTKKCRLSFSAS